MKKINEKVSKKVIYIIIFIMIYSFIIPKISYGIDDDGGGTLLTPISQFLCFVPDKVIEILQNMFISPDSIYENDEYQILYSPGAIFSGKVPAFSIDFITSNGSNSLMVPVKIESTTKMATAATLEDLAEQIANRLTSSCTVENNSSKDTIENLCSKIKQEVENSGMSAEYDEQITIENITLNIKAANMGAGDWTLFCVNLGTGQTIFSENTSLDYATATKPEQIVEHFREFLIGYVNSNVNTSNDSNSVLALKDKNNIKNLIINLKDSIQKEQEEKPGEIIERKLTYTHECNKKVESFNISFNLQETNPYSCYISESNENVKTYMSTPAVLRGVISSWYNAFVKIAAVGLLSVLVYIGIRIVLTSTSASDKAKYKRMLKDWLFAVCILFMLHYIMAFTITIVNKITEIISVSIVKDNKDVLISTLRNDIYNANSWGEALSQVVIYCVLAIYTVIFTIQYLRRVIHIAFLTVIAPLITFTYPLDKIKDNQSQAFDMWIKDYVFYALLQVVHVLLYYVLLCTAIDLVNEQTWLFAVVTIGFLVPAEKLLKKMFGFEKKSKSISALAAGATGALVMDAINKISYKAPKEKNNSNNTSQSNTKMANTPANTSTGGATPLPTGGTGTVGTSDAGSAGSAGGSGTTGGAFKKTITGVGKLAKKYTRPVAKKIVGIGAGLAGATIGVASGIAQGDAKAAFTGFTGGALAGYHGGQKAVDFAMDKPKEIKDIASDIIDTFK